MLKGISVWAFPDHAARSAESICGQAAAHGFQALEPAIGEEGLVNLDSTEDECRRLVDRASEAGLQVCSLASGLGWQYPLTAEQPVQRRRAIEVLRRSVLAASWLGVEALLVVPGNLPLGADDPHAHVPYDVAYERMQAGVAELVPLAEDLGVTMAIENVWNRVLLSPLEMRDFIDGFSSHAVGSYFDVGNVIRNGYAEDWIRILGPRVRAVHFKDYRRSVGTMEGFCELLGGDVNFPAVMEALREIDYDAACVAEYFGLDDDALGNLSEAMDQILSP